MADRTNPSQGSADRTGVSIIGAEKARDAISRSAVQWADQFDDDTNASTSDRVVLAGQLSLGVETDADDEDDDTGVDEAWMDAGDTTLGDLLGTVAPSQVSVPGRAEPLDLTIHASSPELDDLLPEQDRFSADDDLPEATGVDAHDHADHDDDVFPASMYPADEPVVHPPTVTTRLDEDSDTGVIVAAASATLQRRERRIAERSAQHSSSDSSSRNSADEHSEMGIAERRTDAPAAHLDDAPAPQASKRAAAADSERWGAFAGGGPRWRDDAKDWADVDDADTSVLGDDQSRVGTLRARRSERSDLYAIDGDSVGDPSGSASPGTGAARVLRFDSVSTDDDAVIPVRSGGPAQRTGRRPARPGARPGVEPTGTRGSSDGSSGRPAEKPAPAPAQSTIAARLGTGLLLILAVGLVFTFTGTIGAALLAAVAIAMASIELMHALKDRGFRPAIPAVAAGLMGVVGAGMWRGERGVLIAMVLSIATIAAWYLFGAERERPAANLAASYLAFGYPAMGAATAALLLDAPHGLGLLMPAIVCTVANDVFAYAGGRLIGRTHFTDISPNKTVEGLVIGVLGSVAVSALLFGRLGWHPWSGYPQAIALGVVIGVAAPMGDLFESLLKRDLNIKDMGKLLPGHGGVFDRIDAMLVAVPATWLVALAAGHL